ncbi:hypothetical protein SDD30_04195 [Moorella naiadis]|uniref:hypothetical protein n=1 Tax=Moorella naiadis (nom. illeg.) TaxID=3093670 RepID=UPI003D9C97AB
MSDQVYAFRDQACVLESTKTGNLINLEVSRNDKKVLRDLAKKVAELAARPVEDEKRELWYKLNSLEETRPVIFCDPELGWNEIIKDSDLKCEGDLALIWENKLRKEIFWGESMGDDRVTDIYFDVPHIAKSTGWGMDKKVIGDLAEGSYKWEAPLKSYEDMDKLHFPEIIVDYGKSDLVLNQAEEIFGDIFKVRRKNIWWWTLGMTWPLVDLRGLEQIMWDMYDHPEELHRVMAFLRDGHIHMLEFLEKNNLLSLNNDGTYVGSGGFGWTHELPQKDFDGKTVRTIDMWGFAESQETVGVSPAQFEEFVFQYQLPILDRFGLNCYGCCEPLNKRWDIVKKIPHLRRVSVSPKADAKDMAEKLGDRYVFSFKPEPAYLATPMLDEEFIRKYLRSVFQAAKNCNCRVEVILKDTTTIGGNPENVIKWCKIAREEAESL